MNDQTAQVDDLRLAALPNAVNCTELFVRFALAEWSLRPLQDEAIQVACHLVSAAVEHADPKSPGFLTVRLRLRGDCLVIEVEDEQGLALGGVPDSLEGRRTGTVPLNNGGKLLWCELPLPQGMSASSVPLPRREPRKSPVAEQYADEPVGVDPEVMERIISALAKSPRPQGE
ncbi:MAG TPA: ATP-binding protein [Pseudonocardiaceae bacterium]